MPLSGYRYTREQLPEMILARFFPEKTEHETKLLIEYLRDFGAGYDSMMVSAKIGEGAPPDPSHLPGVQRQTVEVSKRRIDFIGWRGAQPVIVELKTRAGAHVLGQLIADRDIWRAERPEDPEPELVAVGRFGTEEELRVLTQRGITVILYPEAPAAAPA